jgi:adenylate cyclase
MTSSLHPQWDFAREFRSIILRFVAFAILVANFLLGGNEGAEGTHCIVVVGYLVISVASVATVRYVPGRSRLKTLFVVLDALLVTLILYAHILAGPVTENHNLTTTSLVVAFILLNHAGLQLERRLVLVFSGIVLFAWVTMLAITAVRHHTADAMSLLASFFNQDLGLTVSFGFTAFAIYLLARDHDRTRKEALRADQRRHNLSRFFSPLIVSELQERGEALGLERRNAAITFVDLRDFTSFAETATARELAFVLADSSFRRRSSTMAGRSTSSSATGSWRCSDSRGPRKTMRTGRSHVRSIWSTHSTTGGTTASAMAIPPLMPRSGCTTAPWSAAFWTAAATASSRSSAMP